MTFAGTTLLIWLEPLNVLMTILLLGYSAVVSPYIASTWPSAAHSKKQDGLSAHGITGLSSMALALARLARTSSLLGSNDPKAINSRTSMKPRDVVG